MLILETAAVAFSMFSALPVPQPVWNQRNMRYAMCAFPLVGLVLGALWWCWAALCCRLALPELLRGAGLCLLPVAVTGGIHLDGYADTSDALASHAPRSGAGRSCQILTAVPLPSFACAPILWGILHSVPLWIPRNRLHCAWDCPSPSPGPCRGLPSRPFRWPRTQGWPIRLLPPPTGGGREPSW